MWTLAVIAALVALGTGGDVLAGKKKTKPPKIADSFRYVYAGEGEPKQTVGNVTIEVRSLINEVQQNPQIFAFTDDEVRAAEGVWKQISGDPNATISNTFVWPTDKNGKKWVNILGDPDGELSIGAFWVKVTNNTDHILNFGKDAKIYFKDGAHDEPVRPMANYENMVQALLAAEKLYDANRKKGLFSMTFPFGLSPSLFKMRFGTSGDTGFVNKDVLPSFGASGLLLFGSWLGKGAATSSEIEVLFFEVPSETNPAGEITARAKCSFKFKQVPIKYWFSTAENRWVEGEPPQVGEE